MICAFCVCMGIKEFFHKKAYDPLSIKLLIIEQVDDENFIF